MLLCVDFEHYKQKEGKRIWLKIKWNNEEALITQSGYQKIEEELEYLKATRRLEVAEKESR